MNHLADPNMSLPTPSPHGHGYPNGLQTPGREAGMSQPQSSLGADAGAQLATQTQMLQSIIMRAKQLFEPPQLNPYDQTRALQLLKAQYVYAKYHINLKVPQE